MASDRNNLYNELSKKDTNTEQFNRTDKRFKLDVEYIQESSAEDASNNLIIESSLNNIQIVVGPTKNIELYGNVLVKESINLQSVVLEDASINLNASIGGSLTVYSDVSLNKSVNILENLDVAGDTSTNNLLVNGRADISENLYVNGDVSFQRNLDVSGKTITTDLTIINDTCLNNNVAIGGKLDVSNVINSEFGIVHADSISFLGGDPVFVEKTNGSSSVLSKLVALGDSSFGNNVLIAGKIDVGSGTATELTSFHNDVSFTKNVQIGLDPNSFLIYDGNFSVYYDSSFDSNVSISRNLNVGATDISDSLNVDGDVSLNSSVDISNKLNVNGDVSLNSKLDVSNNVNLKSKLVVEGDVSLNANVDIAGAFKINDLVVAGDVSYNANIDVSNRLVVNGDISLNSSVDISNKLNVFELNVYNDVSFNNDASIANKLKVGGDVSLNSGLDVTNNLNVVGDVSINSDTKIGNKLVVDGDVSVNSGLDVTNNLNVIGDVCFNSKLIVENDVSLNNNVDISGNIIIGGNTSISGNTIIVGNLEANDVTFADFSATNIIVNENVIQIGKDISLTNPLKIGIGSYAGDSTQGDDTIAIGRQSGLASQGLNSVAIGTKAGQSSQGESSIAIGFEAGYQDQANTLGSSIAIGSQAGYDTQSEYAVAIGNQAGYSSQGQRTVAVGTFTGQVGQNIGATAVGHLAGNTNQGANTVALGYGSGNTNQGAGAVAIGIYAGQNNQGSNSIGIGYYAGRTIQVENSIILNALGTALNADSSGLYIAPIRNGVKNNVIEYDTATKELVYAHQIDISGTITSSDISCGSLTVSGLIDTQNNDLSMGTGTIVCKRVTVDEMTINGDISINNLDILQRFNVLGDTNLLSRLDVTNDVSLNSSLDVNNRLVVYGDVSLNGIVDISDDLLINRLVVRTDASFIGNLDVLGQLGVSDIKLTGDVSFQENVDINKRLMVTLDSSLNGNVTIGINLEVENRLDISGDVSMNNNVSIENNLIVGSSVRGGYDSDVVSYFGRAAIGYPSHNSLSDYASFSHIDMFGAQNYALLQDPNGITSLNAASTKYIDLTINSDTKVRLATDGKLGIGTSDPSALLHVEGDTSLNGNVDISGLINLKSLNATGDLSVNNNLLVGKELKVDGNVSLYSNVTICNELIVNGDVSLNSNNIDVSGILRVYNTIDISLGTLLLRDDQISGDKINGGTIDDISIASLGGPMDCSNQIMSNINVREGIINSITISNDFILINNNEIIGVSNNSVIDISLGSLILRDNQISGDKINGGTIDDISISSLGGAMDCSNQIMSNINVSGGIINSITISNDFILINSNEIIGISNNSVIDISLGTLLLRDDQISGDKINGGTIDNITISEIHGPIDFCNQLMSNVNLSGGIISGIGGTVNSVEFISGSTIDFSAANITFAPNQLTGDSIGGGTIPEITISKLLGAMDCNTQAMTNVNIVSGNLTGVTVNGTITIATLGGAMNANNQIISNVNIDSGDISNVNITANSINGPGILEDIGNAEFNSSKLATVGAIKSYIAYGGGGGADSDISFGDMDLSGTLNANAINLAGHIIPTQDAQYDIGSATRQIKDLYLSSSTLFMGTSTPGVVKSVLTISGGNAVFTGSVVAPSDISTNTKLDELEVSGNVTFTNSESKFAVEGDVSLNKNLDVSGTIKAVSFIGDGSQLTGVASSNTKLDELEVSGNVTFTNSESKFAVEGDVSLNKNLDVSGTIKAVSFIGDGSQLTGITSSNSDVVLDNYNDASLGFVDICKNLMVLGDLSGTTASFSRITLGSEAFIYGPETIYIDPVIAGSPDASGLLVVRGSIQALGTITSVNVETIEVSNNVIVLNANTPSIASAGLTIKDQNDISRALIWQNAPHYRWDISDNLHLGSNLEIEENITLRGRLDATGLINGTLGIALQPNITSLGVLTGLSMEGHLDLSGQNITNVGNLTVTKQSVNDLSVNENLDVSGIIKLKGLNEASQVKALYYNTNTGEITYDNSGVVPGSDVSFSSVDISTNLIVIQDVSVNRNLDVSGLLTVGGLNEASQVKALYYNTNTGEITYDNSGGGGGIVPGSDVSFSSVDISTNLIVIQDVSVNRNLDVGGLLTIGGLNEASQVKALYYNTNTGEITYDNSGGGGIVPGSDVSFSSVDISSNLIIKGDISALGAITGGSFVIGSANISEAELETIDGITAGTAAASKALVLDSNKDIGAIRNLTASGSITGRIVGDISLVDYVVTVASKTSNHPYNGSGSGSGYFLNGLLEAPTLLFEVGKTYRFKQDNNTNGSHQIRFYNDAGKTSAYSTNVSLVGTAGNAGSYSEIFITPQTANVLYYQCVNHGYMGGKIIVSNTTLSHLVDTSAAHFTAINANTTLLSATAGTAAASKALVLDGNKDIGTIRNLTIDGVFTDGNYTFDTNGNVSGLGTLGCGAITSGGNLAVTGTITADTSITLDSTTITTAEIGVLDSVTAGTAAASKALVLDGNKDIGAIRNLTASGSITGRIVGDISLVDYVVTVASKTSNHPYNGIGSGLGYFLNGLLEAPTLLFEVGKTYRFKQDDNTNGSHQIRFYNDAGRTSAYSTNVSLVGTAGNADGYSEIFITPQTANVLYYQCVNHGYMGGKIIVSNTTLSHLVDTSAAHFTAINANTTLLSVTAGTAAASKALVVDSNVDISGIRNITTSGTIKGLDISVNRNLDVNDNLTVTGDVSINTVSGKHLKLSTAKIGIGRDAGQISQGSYALAIGDHAGNSSQGQYSVAVGNFAGETSQGFGNVAIGNVAGRTSQGNYGIAIGFYAGNSNQVTESIAIGSYAGRTSQATKSVAIGTNAGNNNQGEKSVAIGNLAGKDQSANSVAIGNEAGEKQGQGSIAIGNVAGKISQGTAAVAIGQYAGNENQSLNSVAIGNNAGKSKQDINAVALGYEAALTDQSLNAVAIGYQAGYSNQGKDSIAIGSRGGLLNQHSNTIVINATGVTMNTSDTSGLYIDPIKESGQIKALYYNTSTKEITYDNSFVGISSGSDVSLVSLDLSGTFKIQERPVKPVLDNYVTSRNLTVIGGLNSGVNVDNSFTIAYSLDGLDYIGVKDSSNILYKVYDIVYASSRNIWLAAGQGVNYSLAYSYDGIEWKGIENSKGSNFSTRGRVINAETNLIVAGGEGTRTAAYSSDGLNWTYIQIDAGTQTMIDLIYHESTGRFYGAFVDSSPPYQHIKYSTNGSSWTGINVQSSYSELVNCDAIGTDGSRIVVGFTNTNFSGGGNFQHMIYSDDNGSNWNDCSKNNNEAVSKLFTMRALSIKYANGIWIAGGQQYTSNAHVGYSIARSNDGITWTGVSGSTDLMTYVADVEWNGVRWVATGGLGNYSVLYSDDNGLTWTALTDSSRNLINLGFGIGVTGSKNTFATNESLLKVKNSLIDTSAAHFTAINANTTGLAATDLSIAHIVDTSAAHFTAINANTTLLSATAGRASGSKALIVDSNVDITGLRNITTTGRISSAYNTNTTSYFGRTAIGYVGHNNWAGFAHVNNNSQTNYALIQSNSGMTLINSANGEDLNFNHANQTKMRLKSDGKFGIGINEPSAVLHVGGDASFNGFVDISENLTVLSSIHVGGDASFNGFVDISENLTVTGSITSGSLVIGSANISEAELETIDGITAGTASASKALIVDSNVDITGLRNLTATGVLKAGYNTNTTSYFGRSAIGYSGQNDIATFSHVDSNNGSSYGFSQRSNGRTSINAPTGEYITLRINDVAKVKLATDGKLGIGTTSPTSLLHVAGDASFNGTIDVGGDLNLTGQLTGPSTLIIDPAASGNTGLVIIKGGLQVDGSSTIINSSVVDISDHRILLATSAPNSAATDGAGIEISGNKKFTYNATKDVFESNIDLSASGITTTTLRATDASFESVDVANVIKSQFGVFHADIITFGGTESYIAKTNGSASALSRLQVVGDSSFSNNVFINSKLDVGSDVSLVGNVQIGLDPTNGLLTAGTFYVYQYVSSFEKNVSMSSNLAVTGSITSGSLVIGSANISEAELETIDGITAGTASASKALIVDSNVDITGLRNLTATGVLKAGYNTNTTSYFGRTALGYAGYNDMAGFAHIDHNTTSNYALLQTATGRTYLNAVTSQFIGFRINNVDKVILDSDGKLGIGTTSPTSLLTVAGDVSLNGYVDISDNLTVSGSIISRRGIESGKDTDTTSYFGRVAIGARASGTSDGATFAHLDNNTSSNYALLQTSNGETYLNTANGRGINFRINNQSSMRLTSAGNFGIGLNNATKKLEVIGDISASGAIRGGSFVIGSANISEAELETIDGITAGTASASKALIVDSNVDITGLRNLTATGVLKAGYNTNTTSYFGRSAIGYSGQNDIATFSHVDSNNGSSYGFSQRSNGRTSINAPTGERISLRINDVTKVALATDGKLGIGTTSPTSLLHVAGDASFNGTIDVYGNVNYSGSLNHTSDDRFKINETAITNALDTINNINFYQYDKVNTKNGDDIIFKERGVIAQELLNNQDISYAVSGTEEERYAVAYQNIFITACEAIKELNKIIKLQDIRIAALEGEVK